ncbi:MAG: DNA polymerase III subunit alpha [Ignavibacteria bacterium]|nr:DNA polymerase III subunit alpha [Ignavibacteria bacterium]
MFASLHTRSHFSFLDGASSPEEHAAEASRLGHAAIAITDMLGVFAAVRLQRACIEHSITPIMGTDLVCSGSVVSLLAMDHVGYAEICSLISKIRTDPDYEIYDGLSKLERCILILHGLSAERETIEMVLDKLPRQRAFMGIGHDGRPWARRRAGQIVEMARSHSLPVVIAQDVRYATCDRYAAHDLMTCIREGITIYEPHPKRPVNDKQGLRSEAELRSLLPWPEAFDAVDEIVRQCAFNIIPEHITPPSAQLQPGENATEVLRAACEEAFPRRYTERACEARILLEHELRVIGDLELSDFFLVVKEVVDESKRRGIRCSGRGSAANSIVAYLLGITGVCPIQHHLLFERFLHRGRKGTPDIDVDFDSDRRDEVISWMEERFGTDRTAMTATLIMYRARMAVRDAAKALGWPMETVNKLSKCVPSWTNKDVDEFREDLSAVCGDVPLLDVLLRAVHLLLDHPRHLGLHSGGMILSSRPLTDLTPVQRSANGVAVVQFDKDDVEAMGLVKFDVLGLRMLACVSEAVELVLHHTGTVLDIDELPLDDPATFVLIRSGRTLGIFQIESQGQMHLLAKHQPETFDDLVTEVALFRPGPLQGGMVHPYIARRKGTQPVTYLHPDLEPILRDTLGIVLFQEQVLEIAHKFAGMPLDEADDFRALVSKNRDRVLMEAMRERFIQGAMVRGVDRTSAEQVYEKVSHFVGYGFCRSHAAAFAKIVYQSAWLKTHHPAAYMAAFMQHRPGMYNLMTLEEESRRFGVDILLPNMAISGMRYTLETKTDGTAAIRKPLTSVSNVSEEVARMIVWERSRAPFTSIEDIVVRLPDVPRDALDALALSGAMEPWEKDARRAMWMVGVVKRRASGTPTPLVHVPMLHEDDIPKLPEMRAQERLAYDYITHGAARLHPMTLYRRGLIDMEVRPIEMIKRLAVTPGLRVTTAGIVILRQAPATAHGMLFVTIEDETGFLQCVVRPEIRDLFRKDLRSASLVVKGTLHGTANWRGVMVDDVRVLTNVIGGYHGHLSYAGGTDTLEVGLQEQERANVQ